MIFNDLQWSSMIFNDLQWSSMIFNDLQWSSRPSMTFNDLQWSSMIVNDFQWSALISPEIWWHLIKLEIFIRFHSMFWCCLARVFKMFFLLIDILRTYKFQGHFMILHQLSQLCWFPKVLCDRKFTSPLFRMFCLIDYTGLTLTSFHPQDLGKNTAKIWKGQNVAFRFNFTDWTQLWSAVLQGEGDRRIRCARTSSLRLRSKLFEIS